MSSLSKLALLTQRNLESHRKNFNLRACDSLTGLSDGKCRAWIRILSAVASTEGTEQVLMSELNHAFSDHSEILAYLQSHQQDEFRHHEVLKAYLQNTFHYVKTKKTLSDQIIYDFILPKISKSFRIKPTYGIAVLLFFEMYGVSFYQRFKEQAKADGLIELVQVVQQIEKDELRHQAGLNQIFKHLSERSRIWDRLTISLFLKVVVLDVNMSRWALHNRDVRMRISELGLDPDALTQTAYQVARKVIQQASVRGGALC